MQSSDYVLTKLMELQKPIYIERENDFQVHVELAILLYTYIIVKRIILSVILLNIKKPAL